MKNVFSLSAVASIALSLTLSCAAFAGSEIDQAAVRLDNVVNNSLPSQYRDQIQARVEEVKLELAKLDLAFTKLDNVTSNNLPPQYRDMITSKENSHF